MVHSCPHADANALSAAAAAAAAAQPVVTAVVN